MNTDRSARERYLTATLPWTDRPDLDSEVEVDHWFKMRGERYAVVFVLHHGEPLFYVREERHLKPLPEGWESDWPEKS